MKLYKNGVGWGWGGIINSNFRLKDNDLGSALLSLRIAMTMKTTAMTI